jgi:hypothetical protein
MSDLEAPTVVTEATHPLGVTRPPLAIADLPTPEEVFRVPRIGPKETIKYVIGPSLIALGISIGSGEWLLGPLNVGTLGFIGIGWIIFVSALLQVFYNIEFSRYVIATGEVPVVGFARVPPGAWLWVPLTLLVLYFAFIWGGWAKAAAAGLFALINGQVPGDGDTTSVTLLALVLLALVFVLAVLARKVTRALELANALSIGIQLAFLFVICIAIVPVGIWWDGLKGLVTPALPPEGSDATLLGGLAGFTALASGLNWYVMNHYRDKGYGMGYRVGFIAGLRGEQRAIRSVGMTFPDDEKNAKLWRRWRRFLFYDLWGVFFVGAMIGMFLPIILMRHVVLLSGQEPTEDNIPTFTANILGQQYGRWLFYIALFVGFLILFDTQISIFEALVRNLTDSMNMSERFQRLVSGDPRRFYYPFMLVLLIVIGIVLQFFQPARLILISANMSNLGALIFPFAIIYLNRRLPKPARPRWYSYVALLLNFAFFGFFFINFVVNELTGEALVQF